jgi:hypothetical protein
MPNGRGKASKAKCLIRSLSKDEGRHKAKRIEKGINGEEEKEILKPYGRGRGRGRGRRKCVGENRWTSPSFPFPSRLA